VAPGTVIFPDEMALMPLSLIVFSSAANVQLPWGILTVFADVFPFKTTKMFFAAIAVGVIADLVGYQTRYAGLYKL